MNAAIAVAARALSRCDTVAHEAAIAAVQIGTGSSEIVDLEARWSGTFGERDLDGINGIDGQGLNLDSARGCAHRGH